MKIPELKNIANLNQSDKILLIAEEKYEIGNYNFDYYNSPEHVVSLNKEYDKIIWILNYDSCRLNIKIFNHIMQKNTIKNTIFILANVSNKQDVNNILEYIELSGLCYWLGKGYVVIKGRC